MGERTVRYATKHPRAIFVLMALMVLLLGLQMLRIRIDTDPENMLPADQPERVFHREMRRRFAISDMIAVGVVNERHPLGVFNPRSLAAVLELADKIQRIEGVIQQDMIAPSMVDNIRPAGPGTVRFEWLLRKAPETDAEALAIKRAIARLPMMNNTLASADGRAITLYVPISDKTESHRISKQIDAICAGLSSWDDEFHITGLPVAEDTFGVEMFVQMAISAPLAALVIFMVMLWFFRSVALIASPMILAMATVVASMGLLVGLGFTVHIMSSMIPIFLMPIAVVDSVHILSEFADRYEPGDDPREVTAAVMRTLFKPMLFTSLTSAAGFASLAFTPIPPVRVFGVFVAVGILLAFALTVTFIPAYLVSLKATRLARLPQGERKHGGALYRLLPRIGKRSVSWAKAIVLVAVAVAGISAYGITLIEINDNPVRWFGASHRIRIADRVLNRHIGGTYPAYLVFDVQGRAAEDALQRRVTEVLAAGRARGVDLTARWKTLTAAVAGKPGGERLAALLEAIDGRLGDAAEAEVAVWEALQDAVERAQSERKVFQDPAVLRYVEGVQRAVSAAPVVGKSSSVVDLVKTVHRELRDGRAESYRVPDSAQAVAQTLLSFESSHRPNFLWHFVTPDFRSANVWFQLKSGDNRDMVRVTERLERYLRDRPPPAGIRLRWAGMTHLNVVWQQEMVSGMLGSLIGAFGVVLLMMVLLFRSLIFGLLSMLPLSLTIGLIYGLIGITGKAYDMPVAVLSSLTLGLSVDFAIHFLQRTRSLLYVHQGDWRQTLAEVFHEPARAIARNAAVIAVGFLPLLVAPLVPYNTVGVFMAAIMAISGVVTITVLPAVISLLGNRLTRWVRGGPGAPTAEG